jgi:hypothetical protein
MSTFDDLMSPALEALYDAAHLRTTWPAVRALIRSTFVEHLHRAVIYDARQRRTEGTTFSESWSFQTSDRFASPGATRGDLLERLADSLGGRRGLADAMIVVLEIRMDMNLVRTQRVDLDGLATLELVGDVDERILARSYGWRDFSFAYMWRAEARRIPLPLWRWSHRRWLDARSADLRFSVVGRPPLPYRLTLGPVQAVLDDQSPDIIEIAGAFASNAHSQPLA